MENLLFILPFIFSFLTGILIAWSGYLMVTLACLPKDKIHFSKEFAKMLCLIFISLITIVGFLLLFVFTSFAAYHMGILIFIEIWYTSFLYRISISPWNTPCHKLIESLTQKESHIN